MHAHVETLDQQIRGQPVMSLSSTWSWDVQLVFNVFWNAEANDVLFHAHVQTADPVANAWHTTAVDTCHDAANDQSLWTRHWWILNQHT